jgi:hypothetical protein
MHRHILSPADAILHRPNTNCRPANTRWRPPRQRLRPNPVFVSWDFVSWAEIQDAVMRRAIGIVHRRVRNTRAVGVPAWFHYLNRGLAHTFEGSVVGIVVETRDYTQAPAPRQRVAGVTRRTVAVGLAARPQHADSGRRASAAGRTPSTALRASSVCPSQAPGFAFAGQPRRLSLRQLSRGWLEDFTTAVMRSERLAR